MADQSDMTAQGIRQADERLMDFGALSSALAKAISVAPSELTKFQSRLRNFVRLGWPIVETVQGKATQFNRAQYIDFAVVTELTALGIQPEHAIAIAQDNRDPIHFDPDGTLGPCSLRLRPQIGEAVVHSEIQLYLGHYTEAYAQFLASPRRQCGVEKSLRERFNLPERKPVARTLAQDLMKGAKAAADYMGVTPGAIYRMVEAGSIPHIKKGELLFFRKSELDAAFSSEQSD